MRHYVIDLSVSPEERWVSIINDFENDIKFIFNILNRQFSSWKSSAISKLIGLSSYFGYVLHDKEINYISQRLNIPFGKVVLLQIMYELTACCTSAVFLNSENNEYVH